MSVTVQERARLNRGTSADAIYRMVARGLAGRRHAARRRVPGGWVVVTTPNQLSLLSKLTLLRNEFNAFRAGSYPAHPTALLEVDLWRIAAECGWADVAVTYSRRGRIPGTGWHWPRWVSRVAGRTFSVNALVLGDKLGDLRGTR